MISPNRTNDALDIRYFEGFSGPKHGLRKWKKSGVAGEAEMHPQRQTTVPRVVIFHVPS